jgi:purine-binding chemotaxis protein CheW
LSAASSNPKARINWDEVRERLRASEQALREALTENPERTQAAYQKRAIQLAKPQSLPDAKALISVLVFSLQEERYAIPLSQLAEVRAFAGSTPVPGASPEFLGVINLRGELRPVIDLSRIILRAATAAPASGYVLMLRGCVHETGLRVDRIDDLQTIPQESLGPSLEGSYTKRISGETLMLVDVDKLRAELFPKEELSIA